MKEVQEFTNVHGHHFKVGDEFNVRDEEYIVSLGGTVLPDVSGEILNIWEYEATGSFNLYVKLFFSGFFIEASIDPDNIKPYSNTVMD